MGKISKLYSGAMTLDNTHVSKVAGFILIAQGLFFVFYSDRLEEGSPSKKEINILGYITTVVGGLYMLFTLMSTAKLMGN